MINLLLHVDDQVDYRQGLAELLSLEADLAIVGQAENGEKAIALRPLFGPKDTFNQLTRDTCNSSPVTAFSIRKRDKV